MALNKSNRDVNKQFDEKQFNKNFEENDIKINKSNEDITNDIIITKKPHERPIEDIIIIIRETFFKVLEMILDKQNPIPFILSSEERYFSITLFLIIIGTLLLLLSNLMK